jgi:hypothetical protein
MAADFTFTITSEHLSRGLRPSKRVPRDTKYLVECKGAVGRDGVLAAVDSLTKMVTAEVTDVFPFPQLFVFTNMIIVCSQTKIYEWVGDTLTLKLTVAAGSTWSAVDFYDYVYLSNGKVAVTRSPETGVYAASAVLPTAMSILNFNGQVIVGSPSVVVSGVSLSIKAEVFTTTTTQIGSWS